MQECKHLEQINKKNLIRIVTRFNPPPEVGYVTQIAIQISVFTRTRISLIWIGIRPKSLIEHTEWLLGV